ncbi:MAG: hypothetical protein H0U92_06235 [Actinobacteria bacterium]|nr:hypothetical protein [Actinomycetota bacterium]
MQGRRQALDDRDDYVVVFDDDDVDINVNIDIDIDIDIGSGRVNDHRCRAGDLVVNQAGRHSYGRGVAGRAGEPGRHRHYQDAL